MELRKETNGLYGIEKGDDQDEGSAPSNPDIPRIKEMIKSSIIPKIVVCSKVSEKAIQRSNYVVSLVTGAINAPRGETIVGLSVRIQKIESNIDNIILEMRSSGNKTQMFNTLQQRMDHFDQLIASRMKSDQQHEIKMFDKMREISTAQKMLDDATKKMKSLSDSQASMESLVNELKANYTVLSQNVEQEVEASREKDIALAETIDLLEEEL